MNTPNPLVPQGTMPARGKSTFFFKVMMIVTVHIVLIGGMLLQGCGGKTETTSTPPPDTSAPTTDTLPPVTTPGAVSNAQPAAAQNPPPTAPANVPPVVQPTAVTSAPPVVQTPPTAPVTQPALSPVTESKEYVIAAGDTLGAIAHKNGVSLKALLDANAGVNPKKLQIGQKIQIPGGPIMVASAASPGAAAPDAAAGSGDATVYTVKSGDTLSKIARANHTTVKKIMALNDLKTTSIKVSQKLKLPAPKAAGAETPATAVAPLQVQPPPTTTAATTPTTTSN